MSGFQWAFQCASYWAAGYMATFLLEVGTEELPASFVPDALDQWRSRISGSLEEHWLTPETIALYGTPRRLAVMIRGLPLQQLDREEEVKGPAAQAAFKDGVPTKAAEGFARSRGVPVTALEVRSTDKGDFVYVRQQIQGRPTADILTELVPQWITGLTGKRLMRWGNGDLKFPRPIRWLVSLLDDQVLPMTLDTGEEVLQADRISHGHRVLHPETVAIAQAEDYIPTLRDAGVEVDPEHRRSRIVEQAQQVAQGVGGWVQISPDLLDEVIYLVEWPTAIMGRFDDEFLQLPPEVTMTVMVTHQRYFPVLAEEPSGDGELSLLPYFVTISNGDPVRSEVIVPGNERVLRARLADGQFFYQADCAKSLDSFVPQLETVTFQQDLGTVLAKVQRLGQMADWISTQLQVADAVRGQVARAAQLCKADLVSQMVGEFPELQGIMGGKYARVSGEPEAVAIAIGEHYRPQGAGDRPAQSLVGQVVALADRLDTLVSIFGLGMVPSGSSDPFALRRAANGVITTIWSADLPLNLSQLLQQGVAAFIADFSPKQPDTLGSILQEFFLQRLQTLLQEERGIDYDLVNAVLGEGDREYGERALQDLLDVRDRADYLQQIRQDHTLDAIYPTVNRATRLAAQGDLDRQQLDPAAVIQPDRFQADVERAFYGALVDLLPQTQAAKAERDYPRLVRAIAAIAPTLDRFFDGPESVLVMDPDEGIRQNRLNLLGILRNHARVLADFGAIVKS